MARSTAGSFIFGLAGVVLMAVYANAADENCGNNPAQIPFIGHSHNDYEQERFLLLALENGMCSIEVDFYYYNTTFLVAHEPEEIMPNKTVQSMYLDPLVEILTSNDGYLYPGHRYFQGCYPPIIMFDVKDWDPETDTVSSVYDAFDELLATYNEKMPGMWTMWSEGNITYGALRAIISGSRPDPAYVMDKGSWLAAMDLQEPENLKPEYPMALYPMFSMGLDSVLPDGKDITADDSQGAADLTAEDKQIMTHWADLARSQGRLPRYWAIPDTPEMWQILFNIPMGLISTDFPKELREFVFCNPNVLAGALTATNMEALQISG